MDIKSIRYRGDLEDVSALFSEYNLEGIISAAEGEEMSQESSFRNRLLADGAFLLSAPVSPRIFSLTGEISEKLDMAGEFEVFCLNQSDINAFAHMESTEEERLYTIGITSAALEDLSDQEIKFILGHELGHFLFEHNRMGYLINKNQKSSSVTILPSMGESIFLRWRKKSEISADRIGLIASGNFEDSARAMLKTAYGLSGKNLNLDIDSLLKQIDDLKEDPAALELTYRSHPLMPLRLKVLKMFAESPVFRAMMSGVSDASINGVGELEEGVDRWVNWTKRHPRKTVELSVMNLVTAAGIRLMLSENDVVDEEIKIIIHLLHSFFTDDPGEVIEEAIRDRDRIEQNMKRYIRVINEDGDDRHKHFVLSRLADIAIADGKLMNPEAGIIFEVAAAFGIKEKTAYSILVGAMNTVGLRIDQRMNTIARRIKKELNEHFVERMS